MVLRTLIAKLLGPKCWLSPSDC